VENDIPSQRQNQNKKQLNGRNYGTIALISQYRGVISWDNSPQEKKKKKQEYFALVFIYSKN
jgi:hypothetical protein